MKNFLIMRNFVFVILAISVFYCLPSCSEYGTIDDMHCDAVLHATYAGGKATKTAFGQSTTMRDYSEIKWKQGDPINLFYVKDGNPVSACYSARKSGPSSEFDPVTTDSPVNVEDVAASSRYIGLYPFDVTAEASFVNSSVITTIPDEQTAFANTFDPKALLAVGVSQSLDGMNFYNICGGLCFTLQNPGNYSTIEFSGNGTPVAGIVSIDLSTPSQPNVSPVANESKETIILTPDGGSFPLNTETSIFEYFISVLPGDYPDGFKMTFKCKDGSSFDCECTASVTFRRGAFARVNDVDNPQKLAAIRDGVLLSTESETANCYVVTEPGTFIFPLVKGIHPSAALENVASVQVLWETDNSANAPAPGSIISRVSISRNSVYFDVPGPELHSGNALIAAKDSQGDILWSWHIWVSSEGFSTERLEGKTLYMLDRNLGALSSSYTSPNGAVDHSLANGLFYQWGRKDPFPGAVESYLPDTEKGTFFATTAGAFPTYKSLASDKTVSEILDFSVKNPTTYFVNDETWVYDNTLWGDEKTDYDPCPIGWKVPCGYSYTAAYGHDYSKEAWAMDNSKGVRTPTVNFPYYGLLLPLDDGVNKAWYPNNGYVTMSAELVMVGQYSCYWSCSPSGMYAYTLELSQNMSGTLTWSPYQWGKARTEGHSIRCIQDAK